MTMLQPTETINKEIKNYKTEQKGNSGVENISNWNEKFTGWAQQQIWTNSSNN